MSTALFVYGTLQPGQPRWPALAPYAETHAAAGALGRVFDTGYGWPAAVFDPGSADEVPGVVVTLRADSVDEALAVLDAIEGVESGLFHRVLVDVEGRPCWAYHWPGATGGFDRITGWPRR